MNISDFMWLLFQTVWVNGSHASHRCSPGDYVQYLYATFSLPFWGNSGCWIHYNSPRYHVTEDLRRIKRRRWWWYWTIGSMFCIFTYIEHKNKPNVGKYTIHGSYGWWYHVIDSSPFFAGQWESYILPSCRCRRGKCWITDFCEAKITLQWTNLRNWPMFNGKSTFKGSILQPAMLSYKSVTNRNILMIFVAQNEEFFPRGWSVRLEVYICLTHFKHKEALEYVLNSRDCFTLLKMIFLFPQGGDLLVSWRLFLLNVHSGNLR